MAPVKAREVGKGKSVGLPTQLRPGAWAKNSHKKLESLSVECQNQSIVANSVLVSRFWWKPHFF